MCEIYDGKSHTDPSATQFALDVMKYMNKACDRWKEETNIGFSIYGSPIESTTYKFAKMPSETIRYYSGCDG